MKRVIFKIILCSAVSLLLHDRPIAVLVVPGGGVVCIRRASSRWLIAALVLRSARVQRMYRCVVALEIEIRVEVFLADWTDDGLRVVDESHVLAEVGNVRVDSSAN